MLDETRVGPAFVPSSGHDHSSCADGREPARVLLCEDHQIYLAGLRTLLDNDPTVLVAGEVDNVEAACSLAERHTSPVVVVRQGLLDSPEYEPLRRLSSMGAVVLVLAESESELELVRALRAGASGYLSRRLTAGQLLDGVRALVRKEPAFDITVTRHLVRYLTEDREERPSQRRGCSPLDQLTSRQRAVAELVAEGMTNSEIAARLFVSQGTVKSHLATVMRRLDIRSRTQLAILLNRKTDQPA